MLGLFGCFAKNLNDNYINAMIDAINSEKDGIEYQYIGKSFFLGIPNSNSFTETICADESVIYTSYYGKIYNNDINNFNKFLAQLYCDGRLDRLKEINGFFVAAIYDAYKEKLIVINDRHGLIKLYYYVDQNNFCFAPKIRPLLGLIPNKTLKKESLIDFFLFGYLLGDNTLIEHIIQLHPGSFLEISHGNAELTQYWDYQYANISEKKTEEELINELYTLWQRAVERRIKSNKTIIIPLSGGLDSRAILAAALKCVPKERIITFTFGMKGSYDFELGQMIAKRAGVKNIPLGVEESDFEEKYIKSFEDIEGMIDITPYFAINGYEEIKQYGNKIFSGTMIDVLLGRHILSNIFTQDLLNKEILSKNDQIKVNNLIFNRQKLNDVTEIIQLFSPEFLENIDIMSSFNDSHPKFENIKNKKVPDYFAVWDYIHRWNKYIYFAVFRNRNIFQYLTMLDSDLIDFTLKLSPDLRLNERLYKRMLLQKYPDLFKLPTKTNYGKSLDTGSVPIFINRFLIVFIDRMNRISIKYKKRSIFYSKNRNYLDYNELLRTNEEYRNYMQKMISRVKERKYFNKSFIESIWESHQNGNGDYNRIFGLLVTFELFLEEFIDK